MTDREKLVELIAKIQDYGYKTVYEENAMYMHTITAEELADYLLAHGVTVKETQKPLTLEEVKNIRNVIVWAELVSGELFPTRIDGTRLKNLEKWEDVWEVVRSSYKNGWRFWANKPSEEERKAAEWE